MASTALAILGGLLIGGGSGLMRNRAEEKHMAAQMEKELIIKSLLSATEKGELGETHRELMRKVIPSKSIDLTYQTLLELSDKNRWAIEAGIDFRNQAAEAAGLIPPRGGAQEQPQAPPPITGFFPAQTPKALPPTPTVGMPAPGQSVEALPPVAAAPLGPPALSAGAAATEGIAAPPTQVPRAPAAPPDVVRPPIAPTMPARPVPQAAPPAPVPAQAPEAPAVTGVRPEVVQQLVQAGQSKGATRGPAEGTTISIDFGSGVRASVTGKAIAKQKGSAVLSAALGSGATVAETEAALTQVGGEVDDAQFKRHANTVTSQDYRAEYQRLVAGGADPTMAKMEASRRVLERHGYANPNLPKAFEDSGEMRATLSNKILGWALDEGMPLGAARDRGRRMGFPITAEDYRGIQAQVFSRTMGGLVSQGFEPGDAAYFAMVNADGYIPPQFTSAMIPQPSLENMLAMEMFGKPAARLDGGQMGQLRQRLQQEQAGQVGREATSREKGQRQGAFTGVATPAEVKQFPGMPVGGSLAGRAGGGGGAAGTGVGGGGAAPGGVGAPAQAPRGSAAPKVPVEDPFEIKPGVPYSEPSAKQVETDATRAATMRQSTTLLRQFEQAKPQIGPAQENLKINEVRRWFDAMGTDEVTFRSNVDALNQQAIYELTGAQLSIKEIYLRYKWLPKLEDTPRQFLANMRGLQARLWVKHEEDAKARQQAGVRPPQRIPPPPDPKVAYRIFRDANYSHEQALELMRRHGFEVK